MLIGFWGLLTRRNMIKMVLSIAIAESGLQLAMIAIGYINGRTAPILNSETLKLHGALKVVDPVPQALVLTAIVIGVAVNALMLTFVIRLYQQKKSLDISDYRDMKW
ncbi:Membrane bound protein complex subunit mbxG [Caldithrix abyssi DSM 13497]|nr:Membrane bound protein complex subunit mbxG [Caldithrix abyssi DSM 13497]